MTDRLSTGRTPDSDQALPQTVEGSPILAQILMLLAAFKAGLFSSLHLSASIWTGKTGKDAFVGFSPSDNSLKYPFWQDGDHYQSGSVTVPWIDGADDQFQVLEGGTPNLAPRVEVRRDYNSLGHRITAPIQGARF